MKNQHSGHNKIIPIKSLVQNSKQNNKRHYLQIANKDNHPNSGETINTPKSINSHFQNTTISYPRPDSSGHKSNPMSGEKTKGMTVTTSHVNQVHFGQHPKQVSIQKVYQKGYSQLEHLNYSSKTDRFIRQQHGTPGKSIQYNPENKKDSSANVTPKKSRGEESEQKNSFRVALGDKRDSFKSMNLKRGSTQFQKDSSFISGKFEDETWNASRFQNVLPSQRQTQPLFKNDVNKIKTELFQKEAQLFELSQKLQEKENIIKDLVKRLEMANQLNKNLKGQFGREGDSQKFKLNSQIERLSEQVLMLTFELNSKKQKYEKEEESSLTNKKLFMLKVKQFELEDAQKTQYIKDLKEKEKRALENFQKINNGQKQLLRQKQNQLAKISQAAQFYKDEVSKNIVSTQILNKNIQSKEQVIRELSGEVSDLKNSLDELQIRMRQMIESEDDLKNEIQTTRDSSELKQIIQQLQKQIRSKSEQIDKLSTQNSNYLQKIQQLQLNLSRRNEKEVCQVQDFQLSMMQKTCDQYKRKIDDYHQYSEEMRLQITQLRKLLQGKDHELLQLKLKHGDSTHKYKRSPHKSLSPLKDGTVDQKQFNKLKNMNLRLFKDNEKMNAVIKDQNSKIYQFYKVNKSLNEVIVGNDVERLNYHLSKKWKD